jgi:3-methyladenine DNA glycosylase AlkD
VSGQDDDAPEVPAPPMEAPTPEQALAALTALADPAKAAGMEAYHKAPRTYLGVPVPQVDRLAQGWRGALDVPGRVALAGALWDTDVHEARVAAARLLTQARMRPDDQAWAMVAGWVETFDGWALADHAAAAGSRRLVQDPSRLDQVEGWLDHPSVWVRRAALVFTLPWTKQNFPKPEELAARDRVLGWCARLAPDRDPFIQKAVAWWLRDLSRHDPERVMDWMATHGATLKSFARKEATRHLE